MKPRLLLLVALLSAMPTVYAQMTRIAPSARTTAPAAAAAQIDYQTLYQREVDRNRDLKTQVATLSARLDAVTHPGGSLVQAYCETPTLSRNTAGASNDCAKNGFGCEPVSGLCRTAARSSDECAAGYIYCATTAGCAQTAAACPSG